MDWLRKWVISFLLYGTSFILTYVIVLVLFRPINDAAIVVLGMVIGYATHRFVEYVKTTKLWTLLS